MVKCGRLFHYFKSGCHQCTSKLSHSFKLNSAFNQKSMSMLKRYYGHIESSSVFILLSMWIGPNFMAELPLAIGSSSISCRLGTVRFISFFKRSFFVADSLLSLTDRLTGPFNVEQIVLQLDISISDAIMNFQDSGFKVSINNPTYFRVVERP